MSGSDEQQKHLDELRERLVQSLNAYQARQKRYNNNAKKGAKANLSSNNRHRQLHLVYKDESTACIQIWGRMLEKTSSASSIVKEPICSEVEVCNFEKHKILAPNLIPLKVIVVKGSEQFLSANEYLPSSPAYSIDSGIWSLSSSNSSPSSSPGSSPNSNKIIPFHYGPRQIFQAHLRERSTSESNFGLKSILKKNASNYIGRFSRSFSECQNIEEKKLDFSDVEKNGDDGVLGVILPRKKRVSFSERLVQERSFRPNSSILGQKKKNQRKMKSKLKKKGTAAFGAEETSTDDEARFCSESETSHDDENSNLSVDDNADSENFISCGLLGIFC